MVVVDANILAYLLMVGDKTAQAQELLRQDSDWHSDSFILVEFANVLTTAIRTRKLALNVAGQLLATAESIIGNGLHAVAHHQVLTVADKYTVSAYDARYLVLAAQLQTPVITEDRKLRAAAPELAMSLADAIAE